MAVHALGDHEPTHAASRHGRDIPRNSLPLASRHHEYAGGATDAIVVVEVDAQARPAGRFRRLHKDPERKPVVHRPVLRLGQLEDLAGEGSLPSRLGRLRHFDAQCLRARSRRVHLRSAHLHRAGGSPSVQLKCIGHHHRFQNLLVDDLGIF